MSSLFKHRLARAVIELQSHAVHTYDEPERSGPSQKREGKEEDEGNFNVYATPYRLYVKSHATAIYGHLRPSTAIYGHLQPSTALQPRLDSVHHPPTKSIHPVSVTLPYRCPSPPLIRVHHPLYHLCSSPPS